MSPFFFSQITITKVSVFRFQRFRFILLTPDTRHLKPSDLVFGI
jgi:hypothetical protein